MDGFCIFLRIKRIFLRIKEIFIKRYIEYLRFVLKYECLEKWVFTLVFYQSIINV